MLVVFHLGNIAERDDHVVFADIGVQTDEDVIPAVFLYGAALEIPRTSGHEIPILVQRPALRNALLNGFAVLGRDKAGQKPEITRNVQSGLLPEERHDSADRHDAAFVKLDHMHGLKGIRQDLEQKVRLQIGVPADLFAENHTGGILKGPNQPDPFLVTHIPHADAAQVHGAAGGAFPGISDVSLFSRHNCADMPLHLRNVRGKNIFLPHGVASLRRCTRSDPQSDQRGVVAVHTGRLALLHLNDPVTGHNPFVCLIPVATITIALSQPQVSVGVHMHTPSDKQYAARTSAVAPPLNRSWSGIRSATVPMPFSRPPSCRRDRSTAGRAGRRASKMPL